MSKAAVGILQLLAALAFAGVCIALAFSKIDPTKVWTAWFTIMVFGFLCYESRRLWGRRLYWAVVAACLFAHLMILLAVQRAYPHLSLFYYVFFGSIEAAGLYLLLLVTVE